MKTAPFWILASAAALTVDPTKLSGIGDGNHTCHLPRFNAKDLLERSRNGRVVFAGDSIGRNQWDLLLCMLASGVSSVSTIYEVKGLVNGIKEDIVTMKQPDKNPTGIETEPYNNIVISEVVRQRMDYGKWKVQFLNITNLSEIRRDGHLSRYREEGTPPGALQDCSHWCLPGVPDTWNELPYAHLISKKFGINTRI